MGITFNWGNSHSGGGGSITGVTGLDIGVTNKFTNNGAFIAGSLIIAALFLRCTPGTTDPGAPSVPGFTTIQDNFHSSSGRLWVGYKIAGVSESGSYAASWANVITTAGWMLLNFSGVDQGNPIDVHAHQNNTTSTQTHEVPSVTPNFVSDYWLAIEARVGSNVPDTPSAPLSLLYDALGNSSSGRPEICAAGAQLTSTSPTGAGTFTQAAFTQPSQGISIGLKAGDPALWPANLVRESTTSTGTGNLSLSAVNGHRRFVEVWSRSGLTFGDRGAENPVVFISNPDATEWEVNQCYLSAIGTLVRSATPIASSNADALVNFSAGTKLVMNALPAELRGAVMDCGLITETVSLKVDHGSIA